MRLRDWRRVLIRVSLLLWWGESREGNYYIIGWTSVVVAGALHIYSNVRQRCFLIGIAGYAERVCFVGGHPEASELRRTKYNRETFGRLPGRWESTTAAIQQHSASNNNGGFILSLNVNSFLSFFFYWNKMSQWHWDDVGERHVIQSKFHQTVIPFDPLATCCYCMKKKKKLKKKKKNEWRWMTSCCGERPGETEGLAPKELLLYPIYSYHSSISPRKTSGTRKKENA